MELFFALVILAGLIALGAFGIWLIISDPPESPEERGQIETQLRALRAATRLNVAFRQAHEALEAEADRHRQEK